MNKGLGEYWVKNRKATLVKVNKISEHKETAKAQLMNANKEEHIYTAVIQKVPAERTDIPRLEKLE